LAAAANGRPECSTPLAISRRRKQSFFRSAFSRRSERSHRGEDQSSWPILGRDPQSHLVISDIAQQTKLLALNASIESARAGEAGKGLVVVAHEANELAKGTAKATGEVSESIAAIQRQAPAI
jgi:hypothetical protein